MPPGHAVGHEGLAEVVVVGEGVSRVRVGDRVVVPFQINCGRCSACRRGATGTCSSLPLMAMYGMAPIAGVDGGGFMSDLVMVPYADAMLLIVPDTIDPIAIASLSDNIPDGWRAVGPYRAELASLDAVDRRVLVVGRLSIGLYAAALAPPSALMSTMSTPTRTGLPLPRSSVPPCTTAPSPTSPGTRIRSPCTPPRTRRCLRPRCARPGRTACYRYRHLLPGFGGNAAAAHVHARRPIRHRPGQRTRGDTGGPELLAGDATVARRRTRRLWEDAPTVWPTMTGKTVFTRAV